MVYLLFEPRFGAADFSARSKIVAIDPIEPHIAKRFRVFGDGLRASGLCGGVAPASFDSAYKCVGSGEVIRVQRRECGAELFASRLIHQGRRTAVDDDAR
jgi:hypothetical protein